MYMFLIETKSKKKSKQIKIRHSNAFDEIWWIINKFGKPLAIPTFPSFTQLDSVFFQGTELKLSDLKLLETIFHLAIILFFNCFFIS